MMNKNSLLALAALVFFSIPSLASAGVSVYDRGVIQYDPSKCWNGYTVMTYSTTNDAILIDMNGNIIREWHGYGAQPVKVFPEGIVMLTKGGSMQDYETLIMMDIDENVLWSYNGYTEYMDANSARQHHDFQVSGNPVGYYAPDQTPTPLEGKVLVLSHATETVPEISPEELISDTIYEVDVQTKEIVWEWNVASVFDQIGFDEGAKESIAMNGGDWMHINSISYVGPNKWWDEDPVKYSAFNPENIIWDARAANFTAITDRNGDLVWKVGPYYDETPELKLLGQIIGQHHAHVIPQGLPGEGNVLMFDNGGANGYQAPSRALPTGRNAFFRDSSRVIEFNPITLEIVWQYSNRSDFYSNYMSSAQRLENGNTLITEAASGRVFEVTQENEIVWEYIKPFGSTAPLHTYRAYRVPYEWIPQLEEPNHYPVPADNSTWIIPSSIGGRGGMAPGGGRGGMAPGDMAPGGGRGDMAPGDMAPGQ